MKTCFKKALNAKFNDDYCLIKTFLERSKKAKPLFFFIG